MLAALEERFHPELSEREAARFADQWVADAGGDPAARMCRMKVRLIEGELAEAQDDAIAAVQGAIAPDDALRDVIELLEDHARQAPPGVVEGLKVMTQQFQELAQVGLPEFGGKR